MNYMFGLHNFNLIKFNYFLKTLFVKYKLVIKFILTFLLVYIALSVLINFICNFLMDLNFIQIT